MSVTITVPDPLAARLRTKAEQQHVSVEEFAARLLAGALEATETEWAEAQRRRLALLHKSAATGLDPNEARDLQDLQAQADHRLEMLDRQRLSDVERMEQEIAAALRKS